MRNLTGLTQSFSKNDNGRCSSLGNRPTEGKSDKGHTWPLRTETTRLLHACFVQNMARELPVSSIDSHSRNEDDSSWRTTCAFRHTRLRRHPSVGKGSWTPPSTARPVDGTRDGKLDAFTGNPASRETGSERGSFGRLRKPYRAVFPGILAVRRLRDLLDHVRPVP